MTADFDGLVVVGKGRHAVVYALNSFQCMKVYNKAVHCRKELKVLQAAQDSAYFPRVHYYGDDYMIRDYFVGPSAVEYIQENGLSKAFTAKLLELIDAFVELNFTKIDCRLSHIIVTEGEVLKIIDPARSMTQDCDYPKRLMQGLDKLGQKETFLRYIEELRPELWENWHYR